MFRCFYFVLTALLAVGMTFAACSKQVEPVAATQNQTMPSAEAKSVCTSLSDGQAALDIFLEVMSAIADASEKETCSEVVKALKRLDNDDTRAKVNRVQILETCPEDVQETLQEANQDRLFSITIRMAGFAKCEDTPQEEEIDSLINAILMLSDDDDDDDDDDDGELEAAIAAMFAQSGGDAEPLAAIPPEAQAALDALIEVMSAVADTSQKETCAEVVEALKLLDNDDIRAKVKNVQILETFPEDVQQALQQANIDRIFSVAIRMSGFTKCEETPQEDEIDKLITAILAPEE